MIKVRYEIIMYGDSEQLELNVQAIRDVFDLMSVRQYEELIEVEGVDHDA